MPSLDIHVDARFDEPAWAGATLLGPFTTWEPTSGGTPACATEVWALTDRDGLYLRIHAYDPDPSGIRRGLGRRDSRLDDDLVAVYLDPSGKGQRAWVFGVNPLGVPLDGVRTSSSDDDLSWDGRWSAAARVVADGWVAEMAIPWRTVRHPADVAALGLLVTRTVARTGESSAWPAVSAERPGWLDQAAIVPGPGAASSGQPLLLVPEVTFAVGSDGLVPARLDLGGRDRLGELGVAPGITGRWDISDATQLVATLNPDFSEVESDAAQIDVNRRYALRYDEKRPFFLEGEEWFDNPLGDVVYTRSMGVPRYGARATVESGPWTVAALHVLDAAPAGSVSEGGGWTDAQLAGQAAWDTVGRVRRGYGAGSYVGLLLSDREVPALGLGNRLASVDGRWQAGDADAVTAAALASQTTGVDAPGAVSTAGEAAWSHGTKHFASYVEETWISPGFRAENGFLPHADWLATSAEADVMVYPDSAVVPRVTLRPAQGEVAFDHAGGLRFYEEEPEVSVRFGDGLYAHASVFVDGEMYAGRFLRYEEPNAGFGGSFTRWLSAYARVYVGTGPVYDEAAPRVGSELSGEGEVRVQAGERLAVALDGQAERMREGDVLDYQGVVGRLRIDAFATPRLSARVILDDSTFDRATDAELLVAWERDPGTAAYVGASAAWEAGAFTGWQALAKVSWALGV